MSWTQPFLEKVKEKNFKKTYSKILEVQKGQETKLILEELEKFVKYEGSQVSTSQVRNIYSKIVKAKNPVDLQLIRPNLAYAAARQEKVFQKNLFAFIDDLIGRVDDQNIDAFKTIMEALVSYHKFYGKK